MHATSVTAVHPMAAVPEKGMYDNISMLQGVGTLWATKNKVKAEIKGCVGGLVMEILKTSIDSPTCMLQVWQRCIMWLLYLRRVCMTI